MTIDIVSNVSFAQFGVEEVSFLVGNGKAIVSMFDPPKSVDFVHR